MLIQMPTTYLCESDFSCLCEIKYGKRNSNSIIHIDQLMKGATETEIIPRFELLVDNMQRRTSH